MCDLVHICSSYCTTLVRWLEHFLESVHQINPIAWGSSEPFFAWLYHTPVWNLHLHIYNSSPFRNYLDMVLGKSSSWQLSFDSVNLILWYFLKVLCPIPLNFGHILIFIDSYFLSIFLIPSKTLKFTAGLSNFNTGEPFKQANLKLTKTLPCRGCITSANQAKLKAFAVARCVPHMIVLRLQTDCTADRCHHRQGCKVFHFQNQQQPGGITRKFQISLPVRGGWCFVTVAASQRRLLLKMTLM